MIIWLHDRCANNSIVIELIFLDMHNFNQNIGQFNKLNSLFFFIMFFYSAKKDYSHLKKKLLPGPITVIGKQVFKRPARFVNVRSEILKKRNKCLSIQSDSQMFGLKLNRKETSV